MKKERDYLVTSTSRFLLNDFFIKLFKKIGRSAVIKKIAINFIDKNLIESNKFGPTLYVYAAGAMYLLNDRTRAKQLFHLATEAKATSKLALRNQATAWLALRQQNEAISCYERYAEQYNDYYFAYSSIAKILHQMSRPHVLGRWQMLASSWDKALRSNKGTVRDWCDYGETLYALERYRDAKEALKKAEKKLPRKWRLNLLKKIAVPIYNFKSKLEKNSIAEKIIGGSARRLVDILLGKTTIRVWYALGRCEEKLGNKNSSQAYFQDIQEYSLGRRTNTLGIGHEHEKNKLWNKAILAYTAQLDVENPDPDILYRIGYIQRRLGKYEEALCSFNQLLRAQSTTKKWLPLYHLGTVFEEQKNYSAAVQYYAKALASYPQEEDWSLIRYRHGLTLAATNKYEQACKSFVKLSAIDKAFEVLNSHIERKGDDENEKIFPTYWWNKGIKKHRQKDWQEAATFYQAALDREPKHCPIGQYLFGYCLYQSGNYEKACEVFLNMLIDRDVFWELNGSVLNQRQPKIGESFAHYFNNLSIRENVVLYESYDGTTIRGNPRAIFESRHLFDMDDNWTHVWVVNNLANIPKEWTGISNVVFIPRNSQRYALFHATAKYIINNSSQPDYIINKEGQKRLNTWHGTPLKTLGRDNKEQANGMGGVQRNLLQATHLISPNAHTTRILLDRYNLRGLFAGTLAETGYPRIDFTLNATDKIKQAIKTELNISNDKPIILYAPTWRGTLKNISLDYTRLDKDLSKLQTLDAQIIFRGHYFLEERIKKLNLPCTVVPSHIDTNKLLSIVDILITDYSSISVDYIPKNKPIIYYIYDDKEYENQRGLYIHPKEMPGHVCYDRNGLINTLKSVLLQSKENSFPKYNLKEFNNFDDGRSTERVINYFFHNKFDYVTYNGKETKTKNILIYTGNLKINGITTALRTLVNNLDRNKVNPILTFPAHLLGQKESRGMLDKIDENVNILPLFGAQKFTKRESIYLGDAQQCMYGSLTKAQLQSIMLTSQRELLRITGNSNLYALIDYSGYDVYWTRLFAFPHENKIKNIIYLHNDMLEEKKEKFWRFPLIFNLYRFYNKLVSVSDSVKKNNINNLSRVYNISENKFISAENVFDPKEVVVNSQQQVSAHDQIILDGAEKIIVSIGRLSPEKAHKKLIYAFQEVHKKYKSIKLLIIGNGPLFNELNKLIDKLNLKNNVYLLGARSNPFPILTKADLFVLSSDHEGQGLVLFEAMALNIPIISTDIPGPQDVLAHGGGVLVENNKDALKLAITDYLEGNLNIPKVPDLEKYKDSALNDFYSKVLNIN